MATRSATRWRRLPATSDGRTARPSPSASWPRPDWPAAWDSPTRRPRSARSGCWPPSACPCAPITSMSTPCSPRSPTTRRRATAACRSCWRRASARFAWSTTCRRRRSARRSASWPARPAEPLMTVLPRAVARRWGPSLGVAGLTALAFAPALAGAFVDFDDLYNFILNVRYRGLGPRHLAWMLGLDPTRHFWGPLTWLTHGFDWTLWGLNPWGFHLTNVLLHAATAAAFVFVAERLLRMAAPDTPSGAIRAAAVAA